MSHSTFDIYHLLLLLLFISSTLIVRADMDGKTYELKVANIDVGGDAVNCKVRPLSFFHLAKATLAV